ncbi:thermonuclease family protein [Caldinitratiruptor microaerophilus]|uniref:thermonuclease family protein n=1 Tax=Caldinitratiruptor microaerophilus TaxID=671077 RepID=UPI00222E0CDD|nr:thermonuclease family protein [Caldinitratiruptor microaerophilus]
MGRLAWWSQPRGRTIAFAATVLLGALGARALTGSLEPDRCRAAAPPAPEESQPVTVRRVVDGDTFVTAGGQIVRLLGVNAPESVDPRRPPEHYGRQAATALRRYLEGRQVLVAPGRSPRDAYGRTLAWVWAAGGDFVNAEVIRRGLARVASFPDNPDYRDLLVLCEWEARRAGRGLWGR